MCQYPNLGLLRPSTGYAVVAKPASKTTNLNPWLGKWAMLWREDS
jgi:hypothetical protein